MVTWRHAQMVLSSAQAMGVPGIAKVGSAPRTGCASCGPGGPEISAVALADHTRATLTALSAVCGSVGPD